MISSLGCLQHSRYVLGQQLLYSSANNNKKEFCTGLVQMQLLMVISVQEQFTSRSRAPIPWPRRPSSSCISSQPRALAVATYAKCGACLPPVTPAPAPSAPAQQQLLEKGLESGQHSEQAAEASSLGTSRTAHGALSTLRHRGLNYSPLKTLSLK